MSTFSFTNPATGQKVEVSGPASLTQAQAEQIFKQQLDAGSLTGLKAGDVINAAKQAAAGLPGALSQLSQAVSIIGSTAQSVAGKATAALSSITNGAASITNGINIADVAKQPSAIMPIGQISVPTLTAGMAATSKLVGQPADTMSNTLGAGKFGFNAAQLEAAGVIKPGVNAKLIQTGANELTAVLSSPAVFTGKNGINNVNDLLGSVAKQDLIQQDLMKTGSSALKQLGIPVNNLTPGAAMGAITAAAKSIPGVANLLNGGSIPADLKSQFNKLIQNNNFAADFSALKVDQSMKAEIVPVPSSDTINRETVNAAANRVVGNAKVPTVEYSKPITPEDPTKYQEELTALNKLELELINSYVNVRNNWRKNPEIGAAVLSQVEGFLSDVDALEGKLLAIERRGNYFKQQFGSNPFKSTIDSKRESYKDDRKLIQALIDAIKQTISNQSS